MNDDMLRVALLTYSTKPRGGVVHTLALAESLVALGHDVDVWCLARGGDAGFFRAVDDRVGVQLVHFPDVIDEPVGARILRSIDVLGVAFRSASQRYDVAHAQDCISANAVPRSIRTVHHLDTFTTPELAACHERAIVQPVGHICVSRSVANEVEAGWGIRPTVIPNGVDYERFAAGAAQDRAATRHAWRARRGRYVLAVGGIEPPQGSAARIEAMAQVQAVHGDLRLVVAGGDTLFDYRDYRDEVLNRVNRLGVDVDVLGPVEHDALPSLVAAAAVFAFPSVKEGFGLAAMEAMAAGVPVIMRDLPVLREIFDGAADFAATPSELADGILRLAAARPDDLIAQRAAGTRLAQRHTWSAAAAAHVDFYRQQRRTKSVAPVSEEPWT